MKANHVLLKLFAAKKAYIATLFKRMVKYSIITLLQIFRKVCQ